MTADYRIALRPDITRTEVLDDVVVKDVSMFRAEMMGKGSLWMHCYLDGDDCVTLEVHAVRSRLFLTVTHQPQPSETVTYEAQP